MHDVSVLSDFLDFCIIFTFLPLIPHYPQAVPSTLQLPRG